MVLVLGLVSWTACSSGAKAASPPVNTGSASTTTRSTARSGFDIGVRLSLIDGAAIITLVASDPSYAGGGWNADSIAAAWTAFLKDCATAPTCAAHGDLDGGVDGRVERGGARRCWSASVTTGGRPSLLA